MAGLTFEIGGPKYLKVYVFEPQALFWVVLVVAGAVWAAAGAVCAAAATFVAAAGAFFAAAVAFFYRAFKTALQDQSSLFIMQIRCLWRE